MFTQLVKIFRLEAAANALYKERILHGCRHLHLGQDAAKVEAGSGPNKDDHVIPADDDLYRFLWIKCQAHDTSVLNSYEQFMKSAAKHLDINYVRTEEPFRVIRRRTLLASRHVHKKYRVQYESRTYYRDLLFKNLTGSTADTFLEYVERNLPEGVLMIAEKHKLEAIPFEFPDSNSVQEEQIGEK